MELREKYKFDTNWYPLQIDSKKEIVWCSFILHALILP